MVAMHTLPLAASLRVQKEVIKCNWYDSGTTNITQCVLSVVNSNTSTALSHSMFPTNISLLGLSHFLIPFSCISHKRHSSNDQTLLLQGFHKKLSSSSSPLPLFAGKILNTFFPLLDEDLWRKDGSGLDDRPSM